MNRNTTTNSSTTTFSNNSTLFIFLIGMICGFVSFGLFYTTTIISSLSKSLILSSSSIDISKHHQQQQHQQHQSLKKSSSLIAPSLLSASFKDSYTSSSSSSTTTTTTKTYIPSILEDHIMKNADIYNFHEIINNPTGCRLWTQTENTTNTIVVPQYIHELYIQYKEQLQKYNQLNTIQDFQIRQQQYIQQQQGNISTVSSSSNTDNADNNDHQQQQDQQQQTPILYTDIRHAIEQYGHDIVCNHFVPIPFHTIFNTDTLSKIVHHHNHNNNNPDDNLQQQQQQQQEDEVVGNNGYIEPLLPPLRHLEFCNNEGKHLLDLTYIIHDFQTICYNTITPYHTRTIFIDMGASLVFHGSDPNSPAAYISHIYQQYGIIFDHIYAYEYTHFDADRTKQIFESLLPNEWQLSYHWMNVGVTSDIDSKLNPFTMIKQHYHPNDFIVVKLDIDTPHIEVPLAQQLLNDTTLHTLIDQFYFEYHVHVDEMNKYWGLPSDGTGSSIYDALSLMYQLRQKGIASHFWV